MPIPAPSDVHGSSLTFPGLAANIITIDPPEFARAAIDVTHLASTDTKDYIPAKLYEAGEVSLTIELDPSATPPIQEAVGSLVILFKTTAPQTWTFANSFCTKFQPESLESGKKATAKVSFKLTRKPVIAAVP